MADIQNDDTQLETAQNEDAAQENPMAEGTPAPEAQTTDEPTIEPVAEEIDFETFSKSDMRVCKILECTAVKKSKKLLQFTLDDGSGSERTILSGIHAYYEPEELVGKTVLAIVNIPPRRMMGIDSCGMLLSAIYEVNGEERLHLVMLDDTIPAGAKLY
jgi:methionine--tRNA ligase beta chain